MTEQVDETVHILNNKFHGGLGENLLTTTIVQLKSKLLLFNLSVTHCTKTSTNNVNITTFFFMLILTRNLMKHLTNYDHNKSWLKIKYKFILDDTTDLMTQQFNQFKIYYA